MNRQARRTKMLNSFKTKQLGTCVNVTAKDYQKLVRLRAADSAGMCKCVTCGKRVFWTAAHGSHFIHHVNSVRFHPWNVHACCNHCNTYREGALAEYHQFILKTYGEKGLATLRKISKETKVFTREELVEMRLEFLDEIKRIGQKFVGRR